MARISGQLIHGLKIGKSTYKDFELHDHLTAGQIVDAKLQATRTQPFEHQGKVVPVAIEIPALAGALMLCQQIARIGVLQGPLDYDLFARLHQQDLDVLNVYADLAAGAIDADELGHKLTAMGLETSSEVTHRGRNDRAGGESAGDGIEAAQEGHPDE